MVHMGFRRAYGSVSVCLPHAIDRHNHGKQQDDHVLSYGSSSSMEKGLNGLRGDMVGISMGWISFSSRQPNSKRHRETFETDAGHSTPEEVSIEVSMALAGDASVGTVGCCLFHKGLWNGNVCQTLFMSHSFGLLRQIKSLHCLFLSICPPSLLSRPSLLPSPPPLCQVLRQESVLLQAFDGVIGHHATVSLGLGEGGVDGRFDLGGDGRDFGDDLVHGCFEPLFN